MWVLRAEKLILLNLRPASWVGINKLKITFFQPFDYCTFAPEVAVNLTITGLPSASFTGISFAASKV